MQLDETRARPRGAVLGKAQKISENSTEEEEREMEQEHLKPQILLVAAAIIVWGAHTSVATATEPCGDFGECKALIEINGSDGDIGFHFLKDGDDLRATHIEDPNGQKVFEDKAKGPLVEQKYTEIFGESAEPLCWEDPDADPDEEIVTLEEFVARWAAGTYSFFGQGDQGEVSMGETELTHNLPAAPVDLSFSNGIISWAPGNDLGECADFDELTALVAEGVLPTDPAAVPVAVWEVVFEPDDGSGLNFTVRVPVGQTSVTVPADYLASLPANTPAKIEVGAITEDDNATFTEEDGFCINEQGDGCEEE